MDGKWEVGGRGGVPLGGWPVLLKHRSCHALRWLVL